MSQTQMQSLGTMLWTRVFVSLKIRIYTDISWATGRIIIHRSFKKYSWFRYESGTRVRLLIRNYPYQSFEFEEIGHVESNQESNQSVLVEFIPDLFLCLVQIQAMWLKHTHWLWIRQWGRDTICSIFNRWYRTRQNHTNGVSDYST